MQKIFVISAQPTHPLSVQLSYQSCLTFGVEVLETSEWGIVVDVIGVSVGVGEEGEEEVPVPVGLAAGQEELDVVLLEELELGRAVQL